MEKWWDRTTEEWVHLFIHALGPIPTAWYLDVDLHQRTRYWETLKDEFLGKFGLTGGSEALDEALQDIDTFVFGESSPYSAGVRPTWETQMQDIVECHKITIEDCEADPRNVSIIQSAGECTVAGPPLHTVDVTKPLTPRSTKMDPEEQLKLAKIGKYWDDGTVGNFAELLMEYQDLCPV